MPHHDLQKARQTFSPVFDYIVREAICEDFTREGRDRDARALPLQNITEVFKVAISAANRAILEFESGNVGPGHDLVGRVEVFGCSMRLRIDNLQRKLAKGKRR